MNGRELPEEGGHEQPEERILWILALLHHLQDSLQELLPVQQALLVHEPAQLLHTAKQLA